MTKTDSLDKTRQVVDCGAAVHIDQSVLDHGVIFIHPDLPLFKLFLQIDLKKKIVKKYNFELVKPKDEHVKHFVVQLREDGDDQKIILPDDKKLVI